jgi:hypothetical protein
MTKSAPLAIGLASRSESPIHRFMQIVLHRRDVLRHVLAK